MGTTEDLELPTDERFPREGEIVDGKYRVGTLLGRGGMGIVLRATHVELGTRVALKLVGGSVDEVARARFAREARAAAQVESDHVARVLDTGTFRDLPYMILELLDGRDLKRELEVRGTLPLVEAADLAIEACHGLAAAHARGIVHRDVKPSNLFLARRPASAPTLKILDFGISTAPVTDLRDDSLTGTASMLGSPLYMSPEQIRDPKSVDARTDVWALGVVLFQMLTGRMPFQGDGTSSTLASVMVDKTPKVRDLVHELPSEIDLVIGRALEKSAKFRCSSVVEMASSLAPFASVRGRELAARLAESATSSGASNDPRELDRMDATAVDAASDEALANTFQGSTAEQDPTRPRRWRMAAMGAIGVVAVLGAVLAPLYFTRVAPPSSGSTKMTSEPASTSVTEKTTATGTSTPQEASTSAMPTPMMAGAPPTTNKPTKPTATGKKPFAPWPKSTALAAPKPSAKPTTNVAPVAAPSKSALGTALDSHE